MSPSHLAHTIHNLTCPSCQDRCSRLISILLDQPEAMRRLYWARHWACGVDVLELLSKEAALLPGGESEGVASDAAKEAFGKVKGALVELMNEQCSISGGLYS